MTKQNVVIIGNGHYVSGMTAMSGVRSTDKDEGILLPSVLALRQQGLVGDITVVGRDGSKLAGLTERLKSWEQKYSWSPKINFFPRDGKVSEAAYLEALDVCPRPAVALIAVPDYLHKAVMVECVKRGIPFFIVKPAVTQLRDLYEVLTLMKEKPVLGVVDYHKVYDIANLTIKAEYDGGAYGRVHHVLSVMTQRRDMIEIFRPWLKKNPTANVNHYLGSHYIHLTGYLTKARPVSVRATAQFGFVQKAIGQAIADRIETHVEWQDATGARFASYHIAGWSDPSESESMTTQELTLHCENGTVRSDQTYRGLKKTLVTSGCRTDNPYFFGALTKPGGNPGFEGKYGFESVRTFVEAAQGGSVHGLPTLAESAATTAILEAADLSLSRKSAVVSIEGQGDRFVVP